MAFTTFLEALDEEDDDERYDLYLACGIALSVIVLALILVVICAIIVGIFKCICKD